MPHCGCGQVSCGGGCGRSIPALCTVSCNRSFFKRSSCGRKRGCNCNGCSTALCILKNTVSARSCCNSETAAVYAYNVQSVTIPASGTFTFDHVGEAHVIVPPGAGGNDSSQFLLLHSGVYSYDFFVRGVTLSGSTPATHPIVVELLANGASVPGSQYVSQDKEVTGEENNLNHFVTGFGLLSVNGNTVIQLRNITGLVTAAVQLNSFPTGGPAGSDLAVNASLRIIRIC